MVVYLNRLDLCRHNVCVQTICASVRLQFCSPRLSAVARHSRGIQMRLYLATAAAAAPQVDQLIGDHHAKKYVSAQQAFSDFVFFDFFPLSVDSNF